MRDTYICGLDLGQANDYTALSIIERAGDDLHVRELRRLRHVPYPKIVTETAELLMLPPLAGATRLVIDRTGVGMAVFDMFAAAGLRPIGVSIHGGDAVTGSEHEGYRVPKRDLVSSVQAGLQSETLKIAAGLEHAATLSAELQNFRITIDPRTAHDSYAAWREADHDDLVLSVALACWYAKRPVFRWGAV